MTTTKTRRMKKTGICGLLAFRAIIDETYKSRIQIPPEGFDYEVRLCHGFPIATGGDACGRRVFHAWLEIGQSNDGHGWRPWFVVDCGSHETDPIKMFLQYEYYHVGKIVAADVQRYTRVEAARECLQSNHTGPWRPTPPDVV